MTDNPQAQGAGADQELVQLQRALASVYRVERLLTRHGTTVVYQAAELNPPRPVALRILPAELGLAAVAARFREAVQAAVRLSHPNLVPIYRMGTRAGVPYFVAMKLVEGRSLSEVISTQGALQVPIILAVLRAVASAVAYAHGQRTTHGALSAANVLLDRNGQVVVAEFGFARVAEEAAAAAAGRAFVTAPEEVAGGPPGPAGDQYALGLIALEMLTGTAQAAADPLTADPVGALRDARAARVAIPDALVKVVQTAVASDPSQRFPSAADLLAAIEAIPFSDADGREATVTLGRLARGESVPKLRALSPPTAAVPRVSGSSAAPKGAAPQPAPPTEFEMPAITIPAAEPPPARAERTIEVEAVRPAAAPPPSPPPPPPSRTSQPFHGRAPSQPAMPAPSEAAPAAPIMRASRARESGHPTAAAVESAPKRRSRVLPVLVTLVLIAAAGAGGYWFGRQSALAPAAPAAKPVAQHPASAPATPVAAAPAESTRADTAHKAPAAAETTKAAPPPAPKTGILLINATPRTAFIFLDNKPVGRRGRLDSAVTAGRRHLEVVAAGYQGWDTVIVVPAGDTLDLGDVPLDSSSTGPAQKDSGGN